MNLFKMQTSFDHSCSTTIATLQDSKKLQLEITYSSNNQKLSIHIIKTYINRYKKNYIDWTIVQNSFNLLCGFPIS